MLPREGEFVRLAPSSIHGVGVFATRDFKKGDRVYANVIPSWHSSKEATEIVIKHWPSVLKGSDFLWPPALWVCFMNHTNDPNYDAPTDMALKDIHIGDEITEDYGEYEKNLL